MKLQISQQQNSILADLQKTLNPTLAMLDLKGNEEILTKALIITNQAIISIQNGEHINPETLFSKAMLIYEQQQNSNE